MQSSVIVPDIKKFLTKTSCSIEPLLSINFHTKTKRFKQINLQKLLLKQLKLAFVWFLKLSVVEIHQFCSI